MVVIVACAVDKYTYDIILVNVWNEMNTRIRRNEKAEHYPLNS